MSPESQTPYRPSILLIDDDPISREVLAMLLEVHGYPVSSAEDGAEALSLLERADPPPEVVLMDTQMPGLSGIELIQSLRAKTRSRIIAISGSEPGGSIRGAADGFLLKPIQPEDLEALLSAGDANPANAAAPVPAPDQIPNQYSSQASGPAIDPQVLAKLKAMMPPSSVYEIYAAVTADLPHRLAALESAMQTGDQAEVARIAHAIKGGCAMIGLIPAVQAAARLESINRIETWSTELSQLHHALAALERILVDEF